MAAIARLALFHEREAQQRAALHGIAEGLAAVVGFGYLLELGRMASSRRPISRKAMPRLVVGLQSSVFGAHLASSARNSSKTSFSGADSPSASACSVDNSSFFAAGVAGSGSTGGGRRQFTHAQLIDLFRQIRHEIFGSECVPFDGTPAGTCSLGPGFSGGVLFAGSSFFGRAGTCPNISWAGTTGSGSITNSNS